MTSDGRSFSITTHVYLWVALIAWCGLPFWAAAVDAWRDTGHMSSVYLGAFASFGIGAAMRLVGVRCSGPGLSFMDGLLYITAFMQTGWAYTSLITVLVGVPLALAGASWIALKSLLQGTGAETGQHSFQALVGFFYRNRMVQ